MRPLSRWFPAAIATLGLVACSSHSEPAATRPQAPADSSPVAPQPTASDAGSASTVAPSAVVIDRDRLWSRAEPCIGHDGALVHCVARIPTGNRPKSLQFSPDGKELWVALHYDRPAVAVYDVATLTLVGAVELGQYGAVEETFSTDGTRVYFSQFETASVYEIDRASRAVLRRLETGSEESKIVHLSPDQKTLYVADWKGHEVSEFDLATGRKRRGLATPGIPRGLYATRDGKSLYVAGYSPSHIYRFDLASGQMTTVASVGGSMRHIAPAEQQGWLYFSDLADAKVWKLDLNSEQASLLAETDQKPNTIDLTPDHRVLFVSNRGANNPESYLNIGPEWGTVLAFDTATGRLLDAIVAGNQTTGLDVSPDGHLLAVSDFLDNRIDVYEIPPTDELLASAGVDRERHRARLTKSGDAWGNKAPKDPSLFADIPITRWAPPAP